MKAAFATHLASSLNYAWRSMLLPDLVLDKRKLYAYVPAHLVPGASNAQRTAALREHHLQEIAQCSPQRTAA